MIKNLFKNKKNRRTGFTLLELMIVSAIFAVVTSVVLVRFSLFNGKILITNLAYDIALSIRQAQTYGLNVRGFGTGGNIVFDTGYGVHFESSSNTSYIFFADLNKDKKYTVNELVESITIRGGHFIKKFCGTTSGANTSCSDLAQIDELDVVFTRPEPDAYISSSGPDVLYQIGAITVSSPQGVEREVKVYSTGQISIGRGI